MSFQNISVDGLTLFKTISLSITSADRLKMLLSNYTLLINLLRRNILL